MAETVCVIGGGSWGTTLATVLSDRGFDVRLWVYEKDLCEIIREERVNRTFLPGIRLPENISPEGSLKDALKDVNALVVCAVPSFAIRAVFTEARGYLPKGAIIVNVAKGIEEGSLLTPTGILREALQDAPPKGMAVLSGPSFAREVSLRLPTAVVAASDDPECSRLVQEAFSTHYFRVYTNPDVIGVELGGALKNVIAIAAGISDGLGLGSNARAALITRGLAEISRLGKRLGASERTFSGLSGLGDLVLTCTAEQSRNYSLGYGVGKGGSLKQMLSAMRQVAEGVKTCAAVIALSARHGVEMPIAGAVNEVLHKGKPPKEAVLSLMTRGLKHE